MKKDKKRQKEEIKKSAIEDKGSDIISLYLYSVKDFVNPKLTTHILIAY